MYIYIDVHPSSTGLIDPHNDQRPVGLIAQLVEHCTGIAGVWVLFPFCLNLSGLSLGAASVTPIIARIIYAEKFQSLFLLRLFSAGC